MAVFRTRTRTRTRTYTHARSRRLVQLVVVTALFAAALAAVVTALVDVARAAPETPRTPPSATAPVSHDDGGSGRRLWSVFKHLWTSVGMAEEAPHVDRRPPPDVRAAARNADGRRTPTVVSVYAAQGRDGSAGGGPRAHTAYFGSRLNEAADQR
ncbi:hypothetical protein [Streptomyces virginiae]